MDKIVGKAAVIALAWVSCANSKEPEDYAKWANRCEAQLGDGAVLDCYRELVRSVVDLDRSIQSMAEGPEQSAVEPAIRAEVETSPKQLYEDEFGAERLEERIAESRKQKLTLRVDSVAKTLRGRLVIIFDNGQVWRQLDSDTTVIPLPNEPRGREATIKRGLMGGYQMKIDGSGRQFRVLRVQ